MPKLIECKREELLAALNLVVPVIGKGSRIPILNHVLIQAQDRKIDIQATDLDHTFHYQIARSGKDRSKVEFTVDGKSLLAFVKAAGKDDLYIILDDDDDGQVSVSAGAARTFSTLPVSDFPHLPAQEKTPATFSMNIGDLKIALDTVSDAISTDDTRFYLRGFYLEPLGANKVQITATDGHRMHTITSPADGVTAMHKATPGIVPAITAKALDKWVTALLRQWKKKEGGGPAMMTVQLGKARINFVCGTARIESKLIDGTFPDYRRVIPSTYGLTAVVDAETLLAALNVTRKRGTVVVFYFDGEKLTLTQKDPDGGMVEETISCDFTGKKPMEVGFNGRYVEACVNALCEEGAIEFLMSYPEKAGHSPAVIRKQGKDNPKTVLMPMRV